jgi:CDP-4-dehydro-6-deoxyglucose reductase
VFTLTVEPDGIVLPVRDGETILEAVTRAGFRFRYGCKGGGCGVCKMDLLSGEVRYDKRVAQVVLPDTERGRVALTCRSIPVTDVVVRIQADDELHLVNPLGLTLAQRELAIS